MNRWIQQKDDGKALFIHSDLSFSLYLLPLLITDCSSYKPDLNGLYIVYVLSVFHCTGLVSFQAVTIVHSLNLARLFASVV